MGKGQRENQTCDWKHHVKLGFRQEFPGQSEALANTLNPSHFLEMYTLNINEKDLIRIFKEIDFFSIGERKSFICKIIIFPLLFEAKKIREGIDFQVLAVQAGYLVDFSLQYTFECALGTCKAGLSEWAYKVSLYQPVLCWR